MISSLIKKREITYLSSYSQFVKKFKRDPRYLEFLGQDYITLNTNIDYRQQYSKCFYQGSGIGQQLSLVGGSNPREIFLEFVQQERIMIEKIKPVFKKLVREHPKDIQFPDKTFETF